MGRRLIPDSCLPRETARRAPCRRQGFHWGLMSPAPWSNRRWVLAFYVGYGNGAAEPGGLDYWVNLIQQGELDVQAVADNFAMSAEARAQYPYFDSPQTATDENRADQLLP